MMFRFLKINFIADVSKGLFRVCFYVFPKIAVYNEQHLSESYIPDVQVAAGYLRKMKLYFKRSCLTVLFLARCIGGN